MTTATSRPNPTASSTKPAPTCFSTRTTRWTGIPGGRRRWARAAAEDKPILLSVGYSACHWCHVMAHESFEDPETAALMNELFVNIKVDREERPDLDAIYMEAVQAMTGRGGWPMTVFLTPDGQPFYGGTYFPPDAALRHARLPATAAGDRRGLAGAPPRDGSGRRPDGGRAQSQRGVAPGGHRAGGRGAGQGRAEPDAQPRPVRGRLRRCAEVPAADEPGLPAAELAAHRRSRRSCEGRHLHAGQDGARRHLRPARRRLPPLQHRRPLARAALREDALRQRPAGAHLPPRLADHRRCRAAGASSRRRWTTCCAR